MYSIFIVGTKLISPFGVKKKLIIAQELVSTKALQPLELGK
jgi:hypothetical protein